MFLFYLGTTLSYLLYQAAVGGLFFILAKATNDPLTTSIFLMIEPALMLLFGIQLAKLIDTFRKKFSPYFYIFLSSITLFSLFFIYLIQHQHAPYILTLLLYSIVVAAFMAERIYRQRFPRDFSNTTKIDHSRVNATTNLANRGAPILSPLALYIFPSGLDEKYLFSFVIISIISAGTFCNLAQKLTFLSQKTEHPQNHQALYSAERIGTWHIWHLSLMNFVLGGLFMVLSQSVLNSTKILPFLQGPSLYFAGFWITMILLIMLPRKKIHLPFSGLYFTAALGLFLTVSSFGGIISVFALGLAGLCYGFAINHIGTFIQSQLDHARYSYYETRAQIGGRIAALIALAMTGLALEFDFTTDFLRGAMGLGSIMSAALLGYIFYRNLHTKG